MTRIAQPATPANRTSPPRHAKATVAQRSWTALPRRRLPPAARQLLPALREAKARLRELYGPRLKGLILYGSFARGRPHRDSDIDLLVLISGDLEAYTEIKAIHQALAAVQARTDACFSVVPYSARTFNSDTDAFTRNVKRDGVLL